MGPSVAQLQEKYCAGDESRVDFDLAFKQLEKSGLVDTRPKVSYENTPGSFVVFVGIVSKREFVYLTENGYKTAQKSIARTSEPLPRVHISGGTFHHSAIRIGRNVDQTLYSQINNESEVIERLAQLLAEQELSTAEKHHAEIVELVNTAKTGDLEKAKPIFPCVFGPAQETLKQAAWGVLTTYVSKQLGL